MPFREIQLKFTGKTPGLLMHNPLELADPTSEASRLIKGVLDRRNKVEADHEELHFLEWKASLYHAPSVGPFMPARNVHGAIQEAGGFFRLKSPLRRASLVSAVDGTDQIPLIYDGPREIEELWRAGFKFIRPLKQTTGGRSTFVVRSSPFFAGWEIKCVLMYDDDEIEPTQMSQVFNRMSRMGALGDMRPNYGRYDLEVIA